MNKENCLAVQKNCLVVQKNCLVGVALYNTRYITLIILFQLYVANNRRYITSVI